MNSPKLQIAENLLKAAVTADTNQQNSDALDLYQQSLDIMIQLLKETNDSHKQIQLTELITHYMTCAENVKLRMKQTNSNSLNTLLSSVSAYMTTPSSSSGQKTTPSSSSGQKTTPSSSSGQKTTPLASSGHRDLKNYSKVQPRGKKPVSKFVRKSDATNTTGGSQQKMSTETKSDEHETQMLSDMLDSSPGVRWDDIAGLDYAKQTIQEAVILPNLRPDLFNGLRAPPKGVLLYGPPGTGKTMIAKAVATESGFKFFNITASSVTSKYVGEGEKLMKAIFTLARKHQPAVIFFDEIDSLLSARKDGEHEASRRLKTEFMVQVDGAATDSSDRILVIGATNIPWELDEAVLRRFVKRIYIPLPDAAARTALVTHLMAKQQQAGGKEVPQNVIKRVVKMTDGYSASDITALCREAAMGPVRDIPAAQLSVFRVEDIRAISEADFVAAKRVCRPSVSSQSLQAFTRWSNMYGSMG